jgi:prephenate dehydrogenase
VQVAIIGLGLVGGSIGLALKASGQTGYEVVGYVRRPEVAPTALSLGMVDRVETSVEEAVKEAEIIVIATPVLSVKEILSRIADCLPRGCVVTDAASTKLEVMRWAEDLLPPTADFIGGHPMAGKEAHGILAAEASLLQGCIYCLTPTKKASTEAIEKVVKMVEQVGATPLFIDAEEHDYLVAGVSHLPMLLSAALVSATTGEASWDKMSKLAASGYRDVTRLASGNPEVNADICLTNRTAILHWVDRFGTELEMYRRLVTTGDKRLEEALAEASKARKEWLSRTR